MHRAECISFFKVSAVDTAGSEMDRRKLKRALLQLKLPENIFAIRRGYGTLPQARGIKIIITLEIGHGRGAGTLVIFGGHMPVSAGTKPDECKK